MRAYQLRMIGETLRVVGESLLKEYEIDENPPGHVLVRLWVLVRSDGRVVLCGNEQHARDGEGEECVAHCLEKWLPVPKRKEGDAR